MNLRVWIIRWKIRRLHCKRMRAVRRLRYAEAYKIKVKEEELRKKLEGATMPNKYYL